MLKNLALSLNILGAKVLLIDLDAQAGLSKSFGLDDYPHAFIDILLGICSVESSHTSLRPGVDIIASNISNSSLSLKIESKYDGGLFALYDILGDYLYGYDYVFLDCPAELNLVTESCFACSDLVVSPTTFSMESLEGVAIARKAANHTFKKLNLKNLSDRHCFVINKFSHRHVAKELEVFKRFSCFLSSDLNKLTFIPDYSQHKMSNKIRSMITQDYIRLAKDLFQLIYKLN